MNYAQGEDMTLNISASDTDGLDLSGGYLSGITGSPVHWTASRLDFAGQSR